jgi:short-subunit dehydrogenase
MMDKYALITGASKGIGKEMALELARAGYHLLLVARSEDELSLLSAQIKNDHQIKVSYLPLDLSLSSASVEVFKWIQHQSVLPSILVNNAGYGLFGSFERLAIADQLNMLQLNINTVVELTHLLLPLLKLQEQAFILNIASTAAYQAVPRLAVYSATKSFILSFSRALRYELKYSTVSVSCLCPGPTSTGFAKRAGLDAFADLADKFNMSPKTVAKAGLKGMFNKKAEIIPGIINWISAFGASHLPKSLIEKVAAGLYKE